MVISHEYRYVFVEVPRTGSTAISAELRANYGGELILNKHSYYSTFLRSATRDEREYRVISGIRHPLDDIVSVYRKFSTKNAAYYVGSRRNIKRHRYVQSNKPTFSEFLKYYYRFPYDNWTSTYHDRFDVIIRFENLQEDFSKALKMIGVEQTRPLPQENRTLRDADYESYYTDDDRDRAVRIFGPYMEKWNYQFPSSWHSPVVPFFSRLQFNLLHWPRKIYWNHVRQNDGAVGRMFRKVFIK